MSISKLQKFPIERQKSFLHIQLLGKNWRQLRSMDSAETVKERYGYLWWIIVASAWFERRRDEDTIQRNKKVNSLKLNNLKRTGRCFEHVFQTKKNLKTLLFQLLSKERTEGKRKGKCCLDCVGVAKMFRKWKMP